MAEGEEPVEGAEAQANPTAAANQGFFAKIVLLGRQCAAYWRALPRVAGVAKQVQQEDEEFCNEARVLAERAEVMNQHFRWGPEHARFVAELLVFLLHLLRHASHTG